MNDARGGLRPQEPAAVAAPAPEGRDRRRHPRVPLFSLVAVRTDECDEPFTEMGVDLSVGGLFVETCAPYVPGSFVEVRLAPDDDLPPIEGVGRVAFRAEHGVGVRFLHVAEPSLTALHAAVRRRLAV